MPGQNAQAGIAATAGQRLTDAGSGHAGRGQAGQNAKGVACGLQRLHLFVQTPEDPAIAALQTHDPLARAGMGHKDRVDRPLRDRGAKPLLAYIDAGHMGRNQGQNLIAHQPVMDHHLGLLQCAIGAKSQVGRRTGACADKGHLRLIGGEDGHVSHGKLPFSDAQYRIFSHFKTMGACR
jgi:hypothetical protein